VNEPNTEITDSTWNSLYKTSGVATLVMMLFFLFDIIAWIVLGPYPSSAEGWFTLLQNNRLVGFLLLSFPTLLGTMLYYLTFFGLYGTLRQINKAYAALAALLAFMGLSILLVTNMAHPMVYLGDRYAAETTEAQKVLLLAAGEAQIATVSTGVNMGGLLAEGAAIIFSVLMLRSSVYGKKIAYLGIVGHGLDLVRIIMILAFLPEEIGSILLMIGGLPQLIWLILVGRRLFQMGKGKQGVSQVV
jgi:hypothetical protein